MIVKNGRTYLWENNISEANLYIQVGRGGNTNQQVKISDTELNDPLITGTNVDIWYSKTEIPVNSEDWKVSLINTTTPSIKNYLNKTTRKITIFIKIVPKAAAIQLGEMGLFVKPDSGDDILISRTIMHKQTLSNTETKILQYTINI